MSGAHPANIHVLADGRRLGWYEFGDPAGVPVIYTSGTPESGLVGACYQDAAAPAGVRLIAPDKPGYGHSDYQPRRRLLDWAADVAALADVLGIARFAVVGESGGTPYTLAIARALPSRVRVAVLLAAIGPMTDAASLAGMRASNRLLFQLARHAPALLYLPLGAMGRALRHPARRERYLRRALATAPEVDRQVGLHPALRDRLDATVDAFRHGARAAVQEMTILGGPWGFDPVEVTVPVHIWHGALDSNAPIAAARLLAAQLPAATTHFMAGSGHTIGYEHREAIMALIAGA